MLSTIWKWVNIIFRKPSAIFWSFHILMICEFTHVMLKVCVKLAALSAEWPGRRKTYGHGETRTHDHAFRGYLLYPWATSPYWTSRLSCHLVELEMSSCLIVVGSKLAQHDLLIFLKSRRTKFDFISHYTLDVKY